MRLTALRNDYAYDGDAGWIEPAFASNTVISEITEIPYLSGCSTPGVNPNSLGKETDENTPLLYTPRTTILSSLRAIWMY